MINDFFFILFWWILLFILGISFLPLTWFLFRKFFDKGYAFAKIIAILLVSYVTWLLGSLRILPFLTETIWLVIFAAIAGNIFLLSKKRQEFQREIKNTWKIFAFEELLFLFCLIFWSFIRGFQPSIQGLEKFMDYGFVNSILKARFFPPADMWLAGETINYYYFGHLITAVLTKLSRINSAIVYNLMIATIFALCFTAAFSLGGNLVTIQKRKAYTLSTCKKVIIAGLLSAFLLTLSGNLHPLYWLITHGNFSGYWYPDATRFIVQKFGAADNTIHEFPLYSFVVADLHGHFLNLPFVLLFLGLVLTIFIQKKLSSSLCIFVSLLLGVFYMTNAWDFPIYFLVLGATVLWFNYLKYGFKVKTLSKTLLFTGSCLLLAVLFSLPFHLHFKSIAKGIALADFHSPAWMLLVLWGFPLFTTISFLTFLLFRKTKYQPADYFILILLTISWVLILIPEIFYVKDIYIHSHQRSNTVFKLTYQSFVIFMLSTGYIFIRILTGIKKKALKILLFTFYFLFFTSVMVYPYFAIRSYYGLTNFQGLYGLSYLERLYPDDYQAILWLKRNVEGQSIIVEAVGESYTDFARVSANTGLPTILGWRVHEWLWRGSFEEPGKRTEEVRQIYESPSLKETRELLEKYEVKYLFLGSLERKQYPGLLEEKFNQLARIVFSSNKTKIYKF